MSNLKNNFTSKLTSVVKTAKKAHFVYTASFADGTQAVIRTSNREYVSVTQIRCNNHFALDRDSGTYSTVNRSDFLFSAKPTASLGKAEQDRVMACVQVVNPPAPKPVVADKVTKHKGYSIREQDQRIGNEIVCSNFSVYDDEGEFLHRAKTLDAAKDWIDAEQAGEHDSPAPEPTDKELAAYQPKIVIDAITNALQKRGNPYSADFKYSDEQHRLEHSGDGDCDRHPLG